MRHELRDAPWNNVLKLPSGAAFSAPSRCATRNRQQFCVAHRIHVDAPAGHVALLDPFACQHGLQLDSLGRNSQIASLQSQLVQPCRVRQQRRSGNCSLGSRLCLQFGNSASDIFIGLHTGAIPIVVRVPSRSERLGGRLPLRDGLSEQFVPMVLCGRIGSIRRKTPAPGRRSFTTAGAGACSD